jgi:hypothetical protein
VLAAGKGCVIKHSNITAYMEVSFSAPIALPAEKEENLPTQQEIPQFSTAAGDVLGKQRIICPCPVVHAVAYSVYRLSYAGSSLPQKTKKGGRKSSANQTTTGGNLKIIIIIIP